MPTTADVRLRPATSGDRDLFRAVYASTRVDELAALPWDEATKDAFIDHQFGAQSAYYAKHYVGASVDVVVVDGTDAGRLFVFRGPHEIRIVDIALLPRFRGRGVGGLLLGALQDEAARTGRRLSIHVEVGNVARRLYERLGFVAQEDRGAHVFMTWAPPAQPKTAS